MIHIRQNCCSGYSQTLRLNVTMSNPYHCQCKPSQLSTIDSASVIQNLLKYNGSLTKYLSKYQYTEKFPAKQPEDRDIKKEGQRRSIVQEKGLRPIIAPKHQPKHPEQQKQKTPRQPEKCQPQKFSPQKNKDVKQPIPRKPKNNEQKIQDHLKQLAKESRYMSDTSFRKYFHKQCFENYGRMNTHGEADGIVYNNYMKSHNINPHSGFNQPMSYETYKNALRTGSPEKYLVPGQNCYGEKSLNKSHLNQRNSKSHVHQGHQEGQKEKFTKERCNVQEIRQEAQQANKMREKYRHFHLAKHSQQSRRHESHSKKKVREQMYRGERDQRRKVISNQISNKSISGMQETRDGNNKNNTKNIAHVSYQNEISRQQQPKRADPEQRRIGGYKQNSLLQQSTIQRCQQGNSLGLKQAESRYGVQVKYNPEDACPNCRIPIEAHRKGGQYGNQKKPGSVKRDRIQEKEQIVQYENRQKAFDQIRNKNRSESCSCHMSGNQCRKCMDGLKEALLERASQDGELAQRILTSAHKQTFYKNYSLKCDLHGPMNPKNYRECCGQLNVLP